MEFVASVSIHKRKVSSGGVSIHYIYHLCADKRIEISDAIFQSISDFCVGFKPKVGQLKQTGEMSV